MTGRWVLLQSDLKSGRRRVMPGRYSTHQRAEVAAERLNSRAKPRQVIYRAMTLPEAEAMAEQERSTRRARLKVKRRARQR